MSDLEQRMDLVGLKFAHGLDILAYFDELPTSFVKCTDMKLFFKLKKHKRKVIKENLEPIMMMEYIIYSPATKHYWYRQIWEHTDFWKLYEFMKDGNLYVRKEAKLPTPDDTILEY